MKHLFLLVSSVLILCTNVSIAQSTSTVDADKKQILERMEQWGQQVIIDGNLDVIKNFYPKSGMHLSYDNQKIEERTVEKSINNISSQFENVKYTGFNMLDDLYIFITEDGHTAITSFTVELEYEALKTKKKDKFTLTGVEVLIKEDGKWVEILGMEEFVKEERKVVVVDKSILDEYNGTYKNEKSGTGNVYTVKNDGKNLIWTTKEGNQFILKPQSEYSFFMEGQPQSVIFGRDKNGNVSFYTFIMDSKCSVVYKVK